MKCESIVQDLIHLIYEHRRNISVEPFSAEELEGNKSTGRLYDLYVKGGQKGEVTKQRIRELNLKRQNELGRAIHRSAVDHDNFL